MSFMLQMVAHRPGADKHHPLQLRFRVPSVAEVAKTFGKSKRASWDRASTSQRRTESAW
ncbi:MAG: hypothetical protein NXI28_10205 [bacterium]|nr:hypothetical protein [bacterium]